MAAIAQPSTGNPWRSFSLDWLTFWLTYASAVNCGCICLSQRSHRDTKPSTESLMSAFVKPSREIKAIPTDHNGWFVLIHPSKMRGRLFRARDSPDAQRGGIASTCGKTITHRIKYRSKYADQFDNTELNEHLCPTIFCQLFNFLPLINEANTERHNVRGHHTKVLEAKIVTLRSS